MKTIKWYLAALLALFCASAHAFDIHLMEGQWAAHVKTGDDPEHYLFLTFNPDRSGVLVRTSGDNTITRTFTADDVVVRTAYLEIRFADDETAILWAWRRNDGLRRVNGLLFEPGAKTSVRNMLPVPLQYLTKRHPLRKDSYIAGLIKRYPYHGSPAP